MPEWFCWLRGNNHPGSWHLEADDVWSLISKEAGYALESVTYLSHLISDFEYSQYVGGERGNWNSKHILFFIWNKTRSSGSNVFWLTEISKKNSVVDSVVCTRASVMNRDTKECHIKRQLCRLFMFKTRVSKQDYLLNMFLCALLFS